MASSDYKKKDREVKGYVEVLYDVFSGSSIATELGFIRYSDRYKKIEKENYTQELSSIYSTPRELSDYAVLHSNYTRLDGSFMLFKKGTNYSGYYSQETVQDCYDYANIYGTGYIDFNLNIGNSSNLISVDTKGITIYFKANKIVDNELFGYNISATLIKPNSNYQSYQAKEIINYGDSLFVSFDESLENGYITIQGFTFEKKDRKIIISHLDLGLSHVYKGSELIEFEVTEQVDKLVEETPNNELKLTVGDYNHLYDPLNPNGIAKYLTEGSSFIPRIGIVLEDNTVEYEKMGVFYFNTIDYNEKEVTMTCYNLMDKISKKNITNDAGYLGIDGDYVCIPKEGIGAYLHHYIEYEYGEYFDELKSNNYITLSNKIRMVTKTFKMTSLANFLQNAVMIDGIFYFDRDNNLVVREVDKTITNSVTKNELLRDIKYTNVEKVTSFDLERTVYSISSTSETNDKYDFETSFTLESTNQVIALESDDINSFYNMQDSYLTVTGASSYHIIKASGKIKNDFNFLIFILVTGTVGSTISIKGKRPYKLNVSQTNEVTKIGTNASLLTINNPFYTTPYWEYDDMFTNFFKKTYSYKVNLDYNGNPMIKAGNYIQVESNYGMVSIFVQKHTLKFNGGLSGSIEGVD